MADHTHDRSTVVVRDGNGMGMILGIVAILVLAAAVWWMAMGPGAGTTDDGGTDVPAPSISLPSVAPDAS
jgi:hypothetical protein